MSFYPVENISIKELKPNSRKLMVFHCDYPGCNKSWEAQYRSRSKSGIDECKHHRMIGHNHSLETKELLSEMFRGKKNPNYKDGSKSIRDCGKSNLYYREWRDRVIKNAKGKCEICSRIPEKDEYFETHHSETKYKDICQTVLARFPEYELEENADIGLAIGKYHVENNVPGMWLCSDCHREIHKNERLVQQEFA